jgi:hypothetical protein
MILPIIAAVTLPLTLIVNFMVTVLNIVILPMQHQGCTARQQPPPPSGSSYGKRAAITKQRVHLHGRLVETQR